MDSAVTRVEVQTQPDGALLVRWEIEGPPVDVDVATGESADHLDHRHEMQVAAGRTSVQLAGLGPGRTFVSVAPRGSGPAVVAADRRIPFEGISNFRDLGGYHTRSGSTVRWGLVFRADALHGLSPADLALYDRLGLRAVYDLRGDVERDERPNPVPSRPLTVVGRPAGTPPPVGPPTGQSVADGENVLRDLYVGLIDHAAAQIGELFTNLGDQGGLPAVFHCHAGKDRTGIVAALLLETLGVDRETVLDDYELTARYRLRTHQEGTYQRLLDLGMSAEAAAGVLTAPRWAMHEALDHLDDRYGGVDRYLTGRAAMSAPALARLRRVLVEGRRDASASTLATGP
ncbi:MAG TPA: tyrosine-protein phosphatase [Acidimicrobiales bacterium]|nr:tyrosine-protein phosphatase [Acidimicrobiales bacterium]